MVRHYNIDRMAIEELEIRKAEALGQALTDAGIQAIAVSQASRTKKTAIPMLRGLGIDILESQFQFVPMISWEDENHESIGILQLCMLDLMGEEVLLMITHQPVLEGLFREISTGIFNFNNLTGMIVDFDGETFTFVDFVRLSE